MTTSARTTEPINGLGVLAAAVAVSAWGASGVIIKDIDMGGLAIAGYRFILFGLASGALLALRGKPPSLRVLRESFWGGAALGLDVAFFFSAVKLTTIANATVIGSLQPIVVSIAAAWLFGERMRGRDVGLGALALAGAIAVVLGAATELEPSRTGDLFAVGALLSWSAYFIFAKRAKDRISPSEYTFGAALWCGLINLPLAVIFGQSLSWPAAESWVGLVILTFGAGILGHSLMNWAIQEIPLWIGSTFTLLIPVVAAGAAWMFLDESLTATQVVAMGVVLLALAGIVVGRSGIGNRPRPLRR